MQNGEVDTALRSELLKALQTVNAELKKAATHIAGEIVADAICGTTERFDLFDSIRHWQLPVGRWAGNQLLALGMLYYRLKERL